jgi:hypothetical protein
MTAKNYAASFMVDQSPDDVFAAINNVRGCWPGEIDGRTDKLGAEFTYRYQDLHRSTQNADVISAIPSESRHAAALRTAEWLHLAAAPTFAIMALLTWVPVPRMVNYPSLGRLLRLVGARFRVQEGKFSSQQADFISEDVLFPQDLGPTPPNQVRLARTAS